MSDLSSVWIEAPVSVQDPPWSRRGRKRACGRTHSEAVAEGRIAYVSALMGEQTRSAMARIVVNNDKGLWRPGLPVTVEVLADETQVPVAVAADAIQDLRDWKVVFGRYDDALKPDRSNWAAATAAMSRSWADSERANAMPRRTVSSSRRNWAKPARATITNPEARR